MRELLPNTKGTFTIVDENFKPIADVETYIDIGEPWPPSGFDDDSWQHERWVDKGASLEIGGYNDNFEELNLPDPKRGIEVKQQPEGYYY